MKNILITLSFVLCTITLSAQQWYTNKDTAQQMAKKQDKPIVLVFQGSDWCAPCIKLDKEIFQSETFKNYAKDHLIMLQADFPKRKKNALSSEQQAHNNALAEQFNKRGVFPLVVVMDNNFNVLGETGYHKTSPAKYISEIENFIK